MKQIAATIIKEFLLLRRDISGMLLLIFMPAVLIIVMALIQDAPFKDYQDIKFKLLLTDNDHGSAAAEIINGLKQSRNFIIIDSLDNQPLSEIQLKQQLQSGKYKAGIVIPKGTTAEMVNAANKIANDISKKLGLGTTLPVRQARENNIKMYFDPVMMPSFRNEINFAVNQYVTSASSKMILTRISRLSATNTGSANKADSAEHLQQYLADIQVKEYPLNDKGLEKTHINSVEHNVPAWAIFGMFFIVVPISGHMIREREEGSALRLALIPGIRHYVSLGRIFFYMIICTIQFALMCCIGIWFMPVIGLPSLYMGVHPFILLPVVLSIAFAATAYGYFIGAVFKTTNQALPFGSISIVILAAMGGIWVPVELLPPSLQHLALISPLHWGLDAVNIIILRNGDWASVLMPVVILLFFGIVTWLLAIITGNNRLSSVQ